MKNTLKKLAAVAFAITLTAVPMNFTDFSADNSTAIVANAKDINVNIETVSYYYHYSEESFISSISVDEGAQGDTKVNAYVGVKKPENEDIIWVQVVKNGQVIEGIENNETFMMQDVCEWTVYLNSSPTTEGVVPMTVGVSPKDISNASRMRIVLTNNSADIYGCAYVFSTSPLVAEIFEENKDYTVSYQDKDGNTISKPTAVGEYKVVVTGKGNYTGSKIQEFKITGDISNATVTMADNSADVARVELNGTALTLDTDYTVSYQDKDGNTISKPTAIGEYKAVITGNNLYTNSVIKEFTITKDISGATVTMADNSADVTNVKLDGTDLVLNKDYTVSYQDKNSAAIEKPTAPGTYKVVITGKGLYKNKAEKEFVIPEPFKEVKLTDLSIFSSKNALCPAKSNVIVRIDGNGNYFIKVSDEWTKTTTNKLKRMAFHDYGYRIIEYVEPTATKEGYYIREKYCKNDGEVFGRTKVKIFKK